MEYSKFLKGITLLSFISLITAFLIYRMGKFDNYLSDNKSQLQTSQDAGAINSAITDTIIPIINDSVQKLMLSSSKVLILTDQKITFFDSFKLRQKTTPGTSGFKKSRMMSSSKSAIIFEPSTKSIYSPDNKKINFYDLDGKKTDTTKIKNYNKQ